MISPPLYLSLTNFARRYDFSPNTIRQKLENFTLNEGEHYILFGNTKRYNPEKILLLLAQPPKVISKVDEILNNFKI